MVFAPQNDFNQDRQKIQSLESWRVKDLAAIFLAAASGQKPLGFQTAQPFGQNIGGNFFRSFQKLVITALLEKQNVPQDQQAPSIPENIQPQRNRALRTDLITSCNRHETIQVTL